MSEITRTTQIYEGFPQIERAIKDGNVAIAILGHAGEKGPKVKLKVTDSTPTPEDKLQNRLNTKYGKGSQVSG